MSLTAIIQAFGKLCEALTAYFTFKMEQEKISGYYNLLDKVDSRLDKLDKQRQILRAQNNSTAQDKADQVILEIEEEQEKKREIIKQFNKL